MHKVHITITHSAKHKQARAQITSTMHKLQITNRKANTNTKHNREHKAQSVNTKHNSKKHKHNREHAQTSTSTITSTKRKT